jgi:hypothetical protein
MPIAIGNKVFEKISFAREDEFEKIVAELADKVFGSKTIYLDVKKKIKGNNIGAIPDGYLIDMTISSEPKLYVIENEIVSHDPFKHIGIQMLKFATSFDEERLKIRQILMDEIAKRPESLKRLQIGCEDARSRNIDNYLDRAVYSEFKGLVIIDEARNELYKVLEKINANISVLEIKTYKTNSNEFAYEYDTLYEPDEEVSTVIDDKQSKKEIVDIQKRRQRRAECDTIIVPAREDGFKSEFLNNNRWFAIRIGAAMKDRIKYIAAYQVAPTSAITHIAEVQEIKPYQDSGKYMIIFKNGAEKIKELKLKDPNKSPQGPVYAKYEDLMKVEFLDEALEY